jgi:hypothetical protein
MERELIIPVKDCHYDRKKMDKFIEWMKPIICIPETFESFANTYEIFDSSSHSRVTNRSKLAGIWEKGVENCFYICYFNKN